MAWKGSRESLIKPCGGVGEMRIMRGNMKGGGEMCACKEEEEVVVGGHGERWCVEPATVIF